MLLFFRAEIDVSNKSADISKIREIFLCHAPNGNKILGEFIKFQVNTISFSKAITVITYFIRGGMIVTPSGKNRLTNTKFCSHIVMSRIKRRPFLLIFPFSRLKIFSRSFPIATRLEFDVPCENNSVPLKYLFHLSRLFHKNPFLEGITIH